jgi:serine/threonine-protein kinase ULK/ATG1
MKYLRENNVSHFDLKPQNLMLCKTHSAGHSCIYTLKIGDFGFAQHLSLGEENSTIKGSPLYMAPEILLKKCYDPSADLWSIGVILYECLFGKAPYSSKTLQELLDKIVNQQRIEIPKHSKISKECEDLLTRLLQHDPKTRISFEDFFNHEFIDLKHAPNDENFERAIQIFSRAVEADTMQNYADAYHLYCDGLQYFVPLIDEEPDAQKRVALKGRARSYMERAEVIKQAFWRVQNTGEFSRQNSDPQPSTDSIQEALIPSHLYQTLYKSSASSPHIQSGLEIGRQAELYEFEKKLELALETYKSSLSVLVPLLQQEPKGRRKDLLAKQIDFWMKEAEAIKSFIIAQKNVEKDEKENHSKIPNCIMS